MTNALTLDEQLVELKRLQIKVERRIKEVEQKIAARGRRGRASRRSRYEPVPDCGTEAKYHWHRANEPDNWPLPAEDLCGCRAAHARHVAEHRAAQKAAREAKVRDEAYHARDREVAQLRRLAGLPPLLRRVS